MVNNIALFKKYTDKLDLVYKKVSCTSDLDSDTSLVRAGTNANEIVIPKISMDGLGDYSRNDGYTQGKVDFTLETVKFNYDRGRRFTVDAMDNEETASKAFGSLSSEFIRTKVVPEMDAFRFSTYSAVTGISKAAPATYVNGEEALKALLTAQSKMDEDEVPAENRYLFVTPTLFNSIFAIDTTKSKEVIASFSKIIKVPQSRFFTAIELNDGKTVGDELLGGFKKATTGKDINFMVIHKTCILQFPKHTVNKIITPEMNQTSDGWMFFYRAYGLADVYENKVSGIYLSHKA